jgi:hypothetical protein
MKVRVMSMRYQGFQRVSKRADHVLSIFKTRIIPSSKATCFYSFGRKIGENGKLKGRKKGPAYKKGTDGFMQYAEGLQADIADLMQGLLCKHEFNGRVLIWVMP